jgi:hypothetical protein
MFHFVESWSTDPKDNQFRVALPQTHLVLCVISKMLRMPNSA